MCFSDAKGRMQWPLSSWIDKPPRVVRVSLGAPLRTLVNLRLGGVLLVPPVK